VLDDAGAIVTTPSGGMHVYFAGSDQPSRRLPRHHLDLRARGGYVLAPPSTVDGRPYQVWRYPGLAGDLDWSRVTRLLEHCLPPLPADRPGSRTWERGGDLSGLVAWTAALAPDSHNRNDGLFWAACRARRTRLPALEPLPARLGNWRGRGLPAQTGRRRDPPHSGSLHQQAGLMNINNEKQPAQANAREAAEGGTRPCSTAPRPPRTGRSLAALYMKRLIASLGNLEPRRGPDRAEPEREAGS
jgi:hypothetical protein